MSARAQSEISVGILANPASGRDIRRLVASASVFPTPEKANMVERLLAGLAAAGVTRVFMMPDLGGIASRVLQAVENHARLSREPWPEVVFFDMPIEDGPADTLRAVEKMVAEGVRAIVVLGGDGTNRLVAAACGQTPILPLSTGTNNVFPVMREATVAGLAAGLVAAGRVSEEAATFTNKLLRLELGGGPRDTALVDLCVSTELFVATRALWKVESLSELFVAFAEADAIGLSAIAGMVRPVARSADHGLKLTLVPPAEAAWVVRAPIAPGLIAAVGIARVEELPAGRSVPLAMARGVIALDGEREIEFKENDRVAVRLERQGPRTIDIDRVMTRAAEAGVLVQRGK